MAQSIGRGAVLRPEEWDHRKFVDLQRLRLSGPTGRRAYRAARELLGARACKRLREWEVFWAFCQSTGLTAAVADVIMLDANSSRPPPPDLECQFHDGVHFFELGEVVQQDVAKARAGVKERTIAKKLVPLRRIWDPLEEILTKKLKKDYNLEARPASLLLYYARQSPFWRLLRPLVLAKAPNIQRIFEPSVFASVWLFDATTNEVLCSFSRSRAPIIN